MDNMLEFAQSATRKIHALYLEALEMTGSPQLAAGMLGGAFAGAMMDLPEPPKIQEVPADE